MLTGKGIGVTEKTLGRIKEIAVALEASKLQRGRKEESFLDSFLNTVRTFTSKVVALHDKMQSREGKEAARTIKDVDKRL